MPTRGAGTDSGSPVHVEAGDGSPSDAAPRSTRCSPGDSGTHTPLEQLMHDTCARWTLDADSQATHRTTLTAVDDSGIGMLPGNGAAASALAFLATYGAIFHLEDPAHELRVEDAPPGVGHVTFAQFVNGVEVIPANVSVDYGRNDHLTTISSSYVPGLIDFDTHPTLSPASALARAVRDMPTHFPGVALAHDGARHSPPVLVVVAGRQPPRLAYGFRLHLRTAAGGPDRGDTFEYLVDAKNGAILAAHSTAIEF